MTESLGEWFYRTREGRRERRKKAERKHVGCSLELACLVASVGETRVAVLAFGENIDLAAEGLRDAGEVLDWRRAEGEDLAWDARKRFGKLDGCHSWSVTRDDEATKCRSEVQEKAAAVVGGSTSVARRVADG